MRFFAGAIGFVALAVQACPAKSATITFEYSGSCVQNCEEADLAYGAPVTGFVSMDDVGYDPDGFFGIEALVDFSITTGDFHLDRASAPYVNFGGPWQVVPGAPTTFYLQASTSDSRSEAGNTIEWSGTAVSSLARVSLRGYCEPDSEFGCGVQFNGAAYVDFPEKVKPVPLPATGWLMVSSVLAVGGWRASRRHGRAPLV